MAILVKTLRDFINGQPDERQIDVFMDTGIGTNLSFGGEGLGTALAIQVQTPWGFELVKKQLEGE